MLGFAGEQGQWALAEEIFSELEGEVLSEMGRGPATTRPHEQASSSHASSDQTPPPPHLTVLPTNPLALPGGPLGDIWGHSRQISHWGGTESPGGDPGTTANWVS